jgi:CrcB protein
MRGWPIVLVGAGGALGAIARWAVGTFAVSRWGNAWPWGTFLINVSGCFFIGFFLTLTSERVIIHEGWRYLFPVGFVGAYTTFSTYEYELFTMVQGGAWLRALSYLVSSTVVGFAAVLLAAWVARRF